MQVLEWFNSNYQKIINEMKNTSHNLSDLELSPYHAEGSVWTHTMMVHSQLLPSVSNELKLAVLLHDIGKPFSQVIREGKGRISFTGHEHYSSFLAIDILNKFEKEVAHIDKEIILFAINYHDILHKAVKMDEENNVFIPEETKQNLNGIFSNKLDLFDFLYQLSYVDMRGRISVDMEKSINKYEYLSNYIPYLGDKKEESKEFKAIFMVGLPGSGKSTKIEEIKKKYSDIEVLSVDEEILKLGKYSYSYDGAWSAKNQKKASNIVFNKMLQCIENKKSFVLDGTNLSLKIRRRRLNAIPNTYEKIAYIQLASVSFIEQVMNERKDKKVSMEIIKDMSKEFVYPSLIEFDKVETTII